VSEKEFNVFGPPGTGKTTYLVRQIKRAAEKHGEHGIMVASFTRAAAVEIADRAELKKSDRVGTLHALCFRHHNSPTIAETKVSEWNERCQENDDDELAISGGGNGSVDDLNEVDRPQGATAGDKLSQVMQRNRARCIPFELWTPSVQQFKIKWDKWKEDAGGYLDFTDLIEKAIDDGMMPSPTVEVGFFDEAQDFSNLEFKLIRQWKRYLSMAILVGDDDQTIYKFKGSNPEALIDNDLPPDHVKTLSQSYRVPRAVHAVAKEWIEEVERRVPKEYAPRDADGSAESEPAFLGNEPGALVDDVEATLAADKDEEERATIMILASCSYMLTPILRELRRRGVPFANKYRTKRGDWNPLARGSEKRTMGTDRIMALVGGVLTDSLPTWGNVAMITENMQAAAFVGKKKEFATLCKTMPTGETASMAELSRWLAPAVLDVLAFADVKGMLALQLASKVGSLEYPATVVSEYGIESVRDRPRVTVGTIHSVKGAEASKIYLLPDISRASMEQWINGDSDSIRRTFYVGMTRAKNDLVLCGASTRWAVPWTI